MKNFIVILVLLTGLSAQAQIASYGGIDVVSTNVTITADAFADDELIQGTKTQTCGVSNLPLLDLSTQINPTYGNPSSEFARLCAIRAVESDDCILTSAQATGIIELGATPTGLFTQIQINTGALHETEIGILYDANAQVDVDFEAQLVIPPSPNLPAGQSVLLNFEYDFWMAAAGLSELISEDEANVSVSALNINGFNLLQAGSFPSSKSSTGPLLANQLKFNGAVVVQVGTPFLLEFVGSSDVSFSDPGIPEVIDNCGLQWEDNVKSVFFGTLNMSIQAPIVPSTPPVTLPTQSFFSVDIGGDRELSDPFATGNEIFDPGDLYKVASPSFPPGGDDGFFADDLFFPFDFPPSAPDPFPALTAAPVGSGAPPFIIGSDYFDVDAFDQLDFIPTQIPGGGSPTPSPSGSFCLNKGEYLFFSFDDDASPHYANSTSGSVPVNSTFSAVTQRCFGSAVGKDEMVEVFNSGPFLGGLSPFTPAASEVTLHPQLGPNPPTTGPSPVNDDVDALNLAYTPGCDIGLLSVDHEATGADASGAPLDPSTIYRFTAPGSPLIPTISSGAIGVPPGTDIDAIEFVSFFDPQTSPAGRFVAMLFSVDNDDPYTPGVDESGGLDPGKVYVSYLNGLALDLDPNGISFRDIDAISSLPNTLNSGTNPQPCNPSNFQLPPQNFALNTGSSGVDLTWLSYPFASGCIVSGNQVSAPNDANIVVQGPAPGQSPVNYFIAYSQLQPNTQYRVRVRCGCNANTLSPYTAYLNFTTPASPGPAPIADIFNSEAASEIVKANAELEIHPNPADNFIVLSTEAEWEGKTTVAIFNSLGQLIDTQLIDASSLGSGYRVETGELPSGWYTVLLTNDANTAESTFFISK